MFTTLALSAGLIVSGVTLGGAKADDAFVAGTYRYNSTDPLGAATHFHLFAKNNITSSVHTHGNIAAETYYGTSEFGSRENFSLAEVAYIGTDIYNVATSSVADTLVVDRSYKLVSGKNGEAGQKILVDSKGNQFHFDHVKTVLFESSTPYIDLDKEFKNLEQLSASYSVQKDSETITYSLVQDQNNRYVDFSGAPVDSNSYVNISYADWTKYSSRIVLKGLDNNSANTGAVVINIDAAGLTEIELAPSDQEAFDRNGKAYAKNEKGSEEYGTLRLIYNIYDSSAANRIYTGKVSFSTSGFGSILAPGAQVTVSGLNGTVIGSSIVHNGGESHRMDVIAIQPIKELPTEAPTEEVTEAPTEAPTEEETEAPTEEVTEAPTEEETEEVTEAPTEEETEAPTEEETEAPTEEETEAPTEEETEAPTEEETEAPTEKETEAPTEKETEAPTEKETEAPTEKETESPTVAPTEAPTLAPTEEETEEETIEIIVAPTKEETEAPTEEETVEIIVAPTAEETEAPAEEETVEVVVAPTAEETEVPAETETTEAVDTGVGSVVIDVVDQDTDKGVAGVVVEVIDKKGEVVEVVKTDEAGKAAVEELPAGDYQVVVIETAEQYTAVKPVQAVKVLGDTVTQASSTLGSSISVAENAASQTVVLGIENKNVLFALILFVLGGLSLAFTGYLAYDIYGKR
jgi:hypothetical protein